MNKMIFKSLLCFALCVLTLTAVSCGDDDDSKIPGGVIPVPQTASIVGNWMVTNVGEEPHIIFFKADGTGGFMEYSTSSGTYHQDGEFRWVQNADAVILSRVQAFMTAYRPWPSHLSTATT